MFQEVEKERLETSKARISIPKQFNLQEQFFKLHENSLKITISSRNGKK